MILVLCFVSALIISALIKILKQEEKEKNLIYEYNQLIEKQTKLLQSKETEQCKICQSLIETDVYDFKGKIKSHTKYFSKLVVQY